MATTATGIANFSLASLGARRIVDIDDDTEKNSRILSLHYNQCRKEVLRSGAWNFATRRKTLSPHADPPEYGFAYQFPMPADFVRLVAVNEISIWDNEIADWFELENGLDSDDLDVGTVLLTDASSIRIKYIADIEDTQRFDPLFVRALSVLLAARAARAITGSDSRGAQLLQEYESIALPKAQFTDGVETRSNENPPILSAIRRSSLVRSRGMAGADDLPLGPTSPTPYP